MDWHCANCGSEHDILDRNGRCPLCQSDAVIFNHKPEVKLVQTGIEKWINDQN